MFALGACVVLAHTQQAAASAFLRANIPTATHVSRELVDQSLSAALAIDPDKRFELEGELRPIYEALPKSAQGNLEPVAVRYAMHRYFMQKHSWIMKGLEPAVGSMNTSSPAGILEDRVPSYIQEMFTNHLHSQGFGLHELAIFAATLSDLVLKEETRKLGEAYANVGISPGQMLGKEEVGSLVEAYLVKFLLPAESNHTTYQAMKNEIKEIFGGWDETVMWAEDLYHTLEYSDGSRRNPFVAGSSPDHVVAIVQEIGNRFGAFQQLECQSMKSILFELELQGTGRVLLSRFYQVGLEGLWNFWEHADYLRDIGALDETDKKHPALIIPNYVSSPANCVGSSSFFAACCRNECENLMDHLERKLAAPTASPQQIIDEVSRLASETVAAPRELSWPLRARLVEIAERHGGNVPLHGRLFAQWMHHAYPRECPLPHGRGQQSPEDWEAASGQTAILQDGDMLKFVVAMGALEHERRMEDLPWDNVEEVLGRQVEARGLLQGLPWRKVAAFLAVASLAVPLVHTYNVLLAKAPLAKGDKHLV